MSGIKYYRLANGEEMPDEFSVVRDVDGEPSEYMFYAPETENAKLRRGTTTRHAKYRTKYGRKVPLCECCGYSIGDIRWHFSPSCGAEVVDE